MLYLAKVEVNLEDYQDCGVVRWPVHTRERRLRIERVEFDKDRFSGALYYRTRALIQPNYDLQTGKCTFGGVRHEVILVRQTQNRDLELPADCGALAGSFPDRYRGRWLVFSPAPRRHGAGHPAPRPPKAPANGHASPSQAQEGPTRPSERPASGDASGSDWQGW